MHGGLGGRRKGPMDKRGVIVFTAAVVNGIFAEDWGRVYGIYFLRREK